MKDLHQAGLSGRLSCFIEGFLKIDSFQSAKAPAYPDCVTRRWEYYKEVSSQ